MLTVAIFLYLLLTLFIGWYAARKVHSAGDYVLAGRKLPLLLTATAFFATWFGAETVLGASSEFVEHGLYGVIEDPFGAALCLLLVGLFYVKPLYKLNILSFGDYFNIRFGKTAEKVSTVLMIVSYFSWIAAQFVAFGIVLHVVSGIDTMYGILLGAFAIILYTFMGGMWAIALSDFVQSIVIIAGMLLVAFTFSEDAGGLTNVIESTPDGFFRFFPKRSVSDYLFYLAAWITIGLGSIPSQDVFQRMMSAKSEKTAIRGAFAGSMMYLTIACIPLYIALCARLAYPEIIEDDTQKALPLMVLNHAGILGQILFFGALLSAIMSSASAAILAPATLFGENLLKPWFSKWSDKKLLSVIRFSVILVAAISLLLALYRGNIYELVAESSAFTLVSLFVPLTAGLYHVRTNKTGALFSMLLGLFTWLVFLPFNQAIPSILPGLAASFIGLLIGNYVGRKNN